MSQSDLVHVDVAIVGGGMSGAVLALSLAALKGQDGAPLQILLLEASAPELNAHPGFDARAIALSAGTCEALARHGLWPHLVPHCSPITHIHVSGPLRPDPAVGGGVWSTRPRSGDRAVGGGHRAARGDRRLPADPYVVPGQA